MKIVVLAEKPSVGRELARVLGCGNRRKGYLEGDKYIVTWGLGHLVTLAEPDSYDKRYKHWQLEDLPMLPEKMKLKVISQSREQFNIIRDLFKRTDIGELIIATDAGREGELVARWIMILGGWKKKPVKRLWISSQTDEAIKQGFAELKPGNQYEQLFKAAVCRAEADWIIGLNITRALTCKFDARLNAGRVQTPTLALIVKREQEISDFVPVDYWQVRATFDKYRGIWQDKQGNTRIFNQDKAQNLVKKIINKSGLISKIDKKMKSEQPPLAYDLTELQRDGNRRFGFSAQKTLSLAQSLYERHKLITYPRTDSRYITADMVQTLPVRLGKISVGIYRKFTEKLLPKPPDPGKRFVNDSRVTDHHAIIPTEQTVILSALTSDELKLYDLVVRRFIAVLYPPYRYESISLLTAVEGEDFISRGKRVIDPGWRIVSDKISEEQDEPEEAEQNLTGLNRGDQKRVADCRSEKSQTKPPSRYTEATLLTAMENPGKFIDDEELRDSIKAGGLGTPATRAEIIEKLIRSNYLERDGKVLLPTPRAFQLLEVVPEELKSAELTAKWEFRLSKIAKGKEPDNIFIQDIRRNAIDLVASIKADMRKLSVTNLSNVKCPQCGKNMMQFNSKLVCSDRHCGYEISGKEDRKNSGMDKKGGKSKREDKMLLSRFGKDSGRNEETLGDLFDF